MKKAATAVLLLSLAISVAPSKVSSLVVAQPAQDGESPEAIRDRMTKLLDYVGLEKKATRTDVDRMVELWSRALIRREAGPRRTAAFRDLFIQYRKLHGMDYSNRPQAVAGLAEAASTLFQGGGRLDLRLPEPRGPIYGDYIDVETRGRGPLRLLLIADAGIDGRELYRSFVVRNKARYTMHTSHCPARAKPVRSPGRKYSMSRAARG